MTGRAVLAGLILAAALGGGWALAQERTAAAGRVPKPVLVQAKGGQCVEPVDFMRRNHMQVLLHHRDRTVREGIRTPQHSLKGCVECHAGPRSGTVVGGRDDFCQSCHAYAAVSIDCFECHATRPREALAGARKP